MRGHFKNRPFFIPSPTTFVLFFTLLAIPIVFNIIVCTIPHIKPVLWNVMPTIRYHMQIIFAILKLLLTSYSRLLKMYSVMRINRFTHISTGCIKKLETLYKCSTTLKNLLIPSFPLKVCIKINSNQIIHF